MRLVFSLDATVQFRLTEAGVKVYKTLFPAAYAKPGEEMTLTVRELLAIFGPAFAAVDDRKRQRLYLFERDELGVIFR